MASLLLIALATAATVSFATRAGLEAHHEIVALLHQMGARTGFHRARLRVALFRGGAARRRHRRRFCGRAVRSPPVRLEFAGVEAVPFLPPIGLHTSEMIWLLAVPAAASMIALATARLSVLGVLRRID